MRVFVQTTASASRLAPTRPRRSSQVWLPLTIGAVGRAAFVKYRFTDKRFSVTTTAPWKSELARGGLDGGGPCLCGCWRAKQGL